jgi:hypothetical protein
VIQQGRILAAERSDMRMLKNARKLPLSHSLTATICGCANRDRISAGDIEQPVRFGTSYSIKGRTVARATSPKCHMRPSSEGLR